VIVRTITVTPFEQNARILADPRAREALIVDPGGDVPAVLAAVPVNEATGSPYRISGVVLTHAHIDHAGGVKRILAEAERLQGERPVLYAHPLEKAMRATVSQQALMFGLSPREYESCPEPDRLIDEGSVVTVGSADFRVLFTPGHSPGHVSLFLPPERWSQHVMHRDGGRVVRETSYDAGLLVAGDTLFAGSIGRTDLPGGDHATLIRSIRQKLLVLPGPTIVLSGHGPDTTIETERRTNPFLR
jgi:glyoxylase-like metal-dependent hydrolase (beta-lactamase superfamily II)